MNKKELLRAINDFRQFGKDANDLNALRSEIFNSLDNDEIQEKTKNSLLQNLYESASTKGIFFLRLTERKTQDLLKTEQDIEEDSYEDDYEDSYSYDEDEDEEEE